MPPIGSTAAMAASSSQGFDPSSLSPMKREIVLSLQKVVEATPWILSATLAGSFLSSDDLEGVSDIDYIVIVDRLDKNRFELLQDAFRESLEPVVNGYDWKLRINATLGPLKFNDQQTAVLHLMPYSREAHIQHVIQSPFTCFDWQLSTAYHRAAMADVYPTFALQPRHFVSARRSISDYLADYRSRVVSYRELICNDLGYEEHKKLKPMTVRDQHEFAYHIIRFLMKNVVKLLTRTNRDLPREQLESEFFQHFPEEEAATRQLFDELATRKKNLDFDPPVKNLDDRIEAFVETFEVQFRRIFFEEATRHVVFRHAETSHNYSKEGEVRFLGRGNPDISPIEKKSLESLAASIASLKDALFFASPLKRCRQSLEMLAATEKVTIDERLQEIDYGNCEGMTVQAARNQHPALFQAWKQGADPRFPGGESTADVASRSLEAMEAIWNSETTDTVTCTHNVVLRCLLGSVLGIPQRDWYRIQIPHLAPITFVRTRDHGVVVDLDPKVEQEIFRNFAQPVSSP